MTKILSLDTSTKVCSIALHEDGNLVGQQAYHLQKSHSSLLPAIIQELLFNCETSMDQLNAVALSAGPGSYTGLRIGTATAKGLCFTLGIPLISVRTLDTLIAQVRPFVPVSSFLCPMLDARRMEVYCKLVKSSGEEMIPTSAVVVEQDTFESFAELPLLLFGNGAGKLNGFLNNTNLHYVEGIEPSAAFMGELAFSKFQKTQFEDLAYFEPDYLKEYQSTTVPQKFTV